MLLTIAAAVLVLGVLIFVHELGHFIAAKAVGVGVPRFSLGLGPVSPIRWRRGETEYVLSWVPFGGYVKMATAEETDEGGLAALEGGVSEESFPPEKLFENKPLWARIVVIVAGVTMNFVFAWLIYTVIAATYGVEVPLARIGSVFADRPAAAAGIQPGDVVIGAGRDTIRDWLEFQSAIESHAGDTVALRILRGSVVLQFAVVPVAEGGDSSGRKVARIGVALDTMQEWPRVRYGATRAVAQGARQTVRTGGMILFVLKGLVTKKISAREIGGPLAIGSLSGQAIRRGPETLLTLIAFVSINLAILNLLPIPVLDGGHLIFLLAEGIRRKPLSLNLRLRLTQVGMALLLVLMLLALTNDVMRWFAK